MNNQHIDCTNRLDENGKPAGGQVSGVGLMISWQNGPLGRGEDRLEPNGTFVETVIRAAKQRIDWYNDNGYGCDENFAAVVHLAAALAALGARTARREAAGTEGTHEGN